jgi:hypothetical protein
MPRLSSTSFKLVGVVFQLQDDALLLFHSYKIDSYLAQCFCRYLSSVEVVHITQTPCEMLVNLESSISALDRIEIQVLQCKHLTPRCWGTEPSR